MRVYTFAYFDVLSKVIFQDRRPLLYNVFVVLYRYLDIFDEK